MYETGIGGEGIIIRPVIDRQACDPLVVVDLKQYVSPSYHSDVNVARLAHKTLCSYQSIQISQAGENEVLQNFTNRRLMC